MAVLIETVDSDDEKSEQTLEDLLHELKIPADYNRAEVPDAPDEDTLARLARWKTRALSALQDLHVLVKRTCDELTQDERAHVVFSVAPFRAGGEEWSDEKMAKASVGELPLPGLHRVMTALTR